MYDQHHGNILDMNVPVCGNINIEVFVLCLFWNIHFSFSSSAFFSDFCSWNKSQIFSFYFCFLLFCCCCCHCFTFRLYFFSLNFSLSLSLSLSLVCLPPSLSLWAICLKYGVEWHCVFWLFWGKNKRNTISDTDKMLLLTEFPVP